MLTGAILAGGESRRFGRNKALEVFQGKRLLDRNVDLLKPLCDPIFVVVNDIVPYYDVRAVLIQDVIMRQGPLGGIYTSLLFSPHEWVFVKAADMPFLVPELLDVMMKRKEETHADAIVPCQGEWYEPLSALYHRRCLPAIADALENSQRQILSFYQKIRLTPLKEEEWRCVDPEGRSFRNINTPEDWKQLQWS